jgi:hypothetical protein
MTVDAYYVTMGGTFLMIITWFFVFEKNMRLGLVVALVVSIAVSTIVCWHYDEIVALGIVVLKWVRNFKFPVFSRKGFLIAVCAIIVVRVLYEVVIILLGVWVGIVRNLLCDNHVQKRPRAHTKVQVAIQPPRPQPPKPQVKPEDRIPYHLRSAFYADGVTPLLMNHGTNFKTAINIYYTQLLKPGTDDSMWFHRDFEYALSYARDGGLILVAEFAYGLKMTDHGDGRYSIRLPVEGGGKLFRPKNGKVKFIAMLRTDGTQYI